MSAAPGAPVGSVHWPGEYTGITCEEEDGTYDDTRYSSASNVTYSTAGAHFLIEFHLKTRYTGKCDKTLICCRRSCSDPVLVAKLRLTDASQDCLCGEEVRVE